KFGAILPIYPSTEGLNQKRLREFTRASLEMAASQIKDVVPQNLRAQRDIPPISETLWNVHFPPDKESAQNARYRLAYEELLVFQSALAIHRQHVKQADGYQFKIGPNVDKRIRRLFPFQFTDAQERVIDEIRSDMSSANPMNRLLQGDVGCGKTAVAVYALLGALAESSKGYQTALMAPTEVLAEQHYLTLESLLAKADVRTMLLSGRSSPAERRSHLKDIASGRVDLVVGTHALIQEDVDFKNLSLIVVDEQHRFGVEQRLTLKEKGTRPDVLIMTATPIPRTLAVACFGDMDVSTIDEMPPGRKKTETHVFSPYRWQKAFETALSRLEKGERLFVVYPLVEENEQIDLTSATEGYEKLSAGLFSNYECCLIHGQMTPEKKREAMAGFREGRYEVMVATTVIEVGVDVPEASVMIIQHAERLGLAQLHQLRGRIGRGESEGLCFLLAEPSTEEAKQRLQVLSETDDGFEIAEADLRIRGPGKLFGTEQSGMPEFRCYDFSDPEVLEQARKDAFRIVEQDPQLEASGHVLLRKAVLKRYSDRMVLGSVG
ncbi:MAG: ATP-dependent DNA helicase RecG, partial [Planctomycetes bacterium]|nr:ATP-dependent DNA helicase RecG [Planctomycetota bacterium]